MGEIDHISSDISVHRADRRSFLRPFVVDLLEESSGESASTTHSDEWTAGV